MSQFSSPLKLAPTSAKRGKASLDWQECVICQTKSPEKLYIFILPQYSTLCSFPSFLYILFVQNIQDCQSHRVVITDEATGEFIQALSEFSYFETVS
jgi:hypothetical protein